MRLNRCEFVGNVSGEPRAPQGKGPVKFQVAVDKQPTKDNPNPGADFLVFSAWAKDGERALAQLTKGTPVYIVARLAPAEWKDKDGKTVKSYNLTVSDFAVLQGNTGRSGGGESRSQQQETTPPPAEEDEGPGDGW